jgi:hypothetical protein
MIAAGYDALAGVAVILLGAGIGVLGSTINAFSTVFASDAARVSFAKGKWLRLVILALTWPASVAIVMRYAARVKADTAQSLVQDLHKGHLQHFGAAQQGAAFTGLHKSVLILFAATFAAMIWGVSVGRRWQAQISALFLISAICIGLIARLGDVRLIKAFLGGAKSCRFAAPYLPAKQKQTCISITRPLQVQSKTWLANTRDPCKCQPFVAPVPSSIFLRFGAVGGWPLERNDHVNRVHSHRRQNEKR